MKLTQFLLFTVLNKLDTIMTDQAALTAKLQGVADQQQKTIGEIQTLQGTVTTLNTTIADLQQQVAQGGQITPELEAVVNKVAELAQLADDQIPDTPPPVDPNA